MAHGSIRRLDRDWGLPGRPEQRPSNRRATQRGSRRRVFDRSNQTLGAFLDEWLLLQRDRLRPSTLYSYDVIVERIKAGLGQVKIQAITPRQIEHFYATLIESGGKRGQGLSGKTVRNTHVVLRKALADAERLDVVARNAAGATKPPTAERPENPHLVIGATA